MPTVISRSASWPGCRRSDREISSTSTYPTRRSPSGSTRLRAAPLFLLDQPTATIADVLRLFHEPEFRLAAAENATNEQVKRFWMADFEKYGRLKVEAISPIENKPGGVPD
jgi:hypothetical protein